jgi:hypothetical protein
MITIKHKLHKETKLLVHIAGKKPKSLTKYTGEPNLQQLLDVR